MDAGDVGRGDAAISGVSLFEVASVAGEGVGGAEDAEAGDGGGTFKQALTRPEAVKSGFTVLGVFVAAPWIARILTLILFVILAIVMVVNKS